jgi:hypothetical protein
LEQRRKPRPTTYPLCITKHFTYPKTTRRFLYHLHGHGGGQWVLGTNKSRRGIACNIDITKLPYQSHTHIIPVQRYRHTRRNLDFGLQLSSAVTLPLFMLKQARRLGYTFTLTTFLICTIPNDDFASASALPLPLPLPAPCPHFDHTHYLIGPCLGISAMSMCIFEKRFLLFLFHNGVYEGSG